MIAASLGDAHEPIVLADCGATERLAARLADAATVGDVFSLMGDLGTGKTTFARAFIRRRALRDGIAIDDIPSPTFSLVQTYDLPGGPVWHFDLYRVDSADEIDELGMDEALATGIVLIEWPDRLGDLLPEDRVDISLAYAADGGRSARVVGHGRVSARVAAARVGG
jgi:tRNA threonylcarbamoyladenosine biosynthesis protein TsaE